MPKPEEVRYTKTHEWVQLNGDQAVVGVSDHAQHEMGDVVFVELPKMSQKLEKDKPCTVVESVKSAFDIYSPMAGEVSAVNGALTGDPAIINQSPLEAGWLFKMKVVSPADFNSLMDWPAYQDFIKQSAH